jgi:hypothetical protein
VLSIAVYAGQIAVGLVFASAALAKLENGDVIRVTLSQLAFPSWAIRRLGPVVVVLEATLALALLSGRVLVVAGFCSAGFAVALAGVSLLAILSGREVSCACFGSSGRMLGRVTLVFAGVLAAACVVSGTVAASTGLASAPPEDALPALGVALVSIAAGRLVTAVRPLLAVESQRKRLLQNVLATAAASGSIGRS